VADERDPAEKKLSSGVARFAWPLAAVAIVAMVIAFLREERKPEPTSKIEVAPSNTVVREIRAIGRLETAALHVEKIVDLKDTQKRMYGLVEAKDVLLYIAVGEVILGVDLGRLGEDDVKFDPKTKVAEVVLPQPEVLSTRFDEQKSRVHTRETDVLAKRNEDLEAAARREATAAFAAAGKEPSAMSRAREQAERQLRTLAKAWGASDLVVRWKEPKGEVDVVTK
jgi:hypothetical protein